MAIDSMGLIAVNIHNVGMIPWLNIRGPRYKITVSAAIYRLMQNDPRIKIYPIEADPIMRQLEADAAAKQSAEEQANLVVADAVVEEPKKMEEVEVNEIPISDDQTTIKDVAEVVENPEGIDFDEAIEAALDELPEEPLENIQPKEEEIEKEMLLTDDFPTYMREELIDITKVRLKEILNVERRFPKGHKYYGGYQDKRDQLIEFIMESQELLLDSE